MIRVLSLGHGETTPVLKKPKWRNQMTYAIAQNFLTLAANATLYTAIALSIFYVLRWTLASPTATEPALELTEELIPDPEPIRVLPPVPAAPRPTEKTLTAIAVTVETEAGKKPTIREMRKALTDAGIKGAGKWKKAKCEEELAKLN